MQGFVGKDALRVGRIKLESGFARLAEEQTSIVAPQINLALPVVKLGTKNTRHVENRWIASFLP
ncbi:hypothetical protein CCZ27_06750 [Thauera sinica]|nr:hypothetical protein CCZ27_06750 [Thauera sp. K11]